VLVAADTWRVSLQADTGIDAKFVVFGVGLVAVLGFQPLKRGLEAASDRMLFQRTYDPARVLGELSRVVTATLELEAIANFLANELAGDMRLSFASVAYHRGASTHIVTAGAAPVVDLRRVAALSKGELVVVDELDEVDPGFVLLEEARVRVLVPITCEGVEIGVIVLGEKQSGVVFSDSDLNFLTLIASEACVAMRNAQLFEEKTARMRELEALNGLTAVLVSDQDVGTLLERALSEAVSVTQAETGSIMMFDAERRLMTIAAGLGIDDEIMRSTQVRMGQGISGWVAQSRRAVVLVDENDPRFKEHAVRGEISSAIAAPIIFKDEVIGVLNLNRVSSPEPFTKENLNVVTAFTGQLAVAIENGQLYEDLESTFLGTIAALAAAVDAKDPYTFGHSTEVTEHAVRIAKQMGLSDEEVHTIRIAGMLHDIGKIGIDRSILHKPGRLSDEERAIINTHPTIGADILAPLDFLKDAIPLILFHHERYNGGGYPSGISGMAIPLGARIISVADSFNAMVSDRPYRKGIPLEEALGELERNAGTQFDPEVVTAFLAERAERNAKRAELRVVQTAQTRRSQAPAIKPPVAEQAPPMAIEG
jgi:putative nucleotidyltransferase with HDIG domain